MVGARGFEPPTSCSQSRRATGLRHAPRNVVNILPLTADHIILIGPSLVKRKWLKIMPFLPSGRLRPRPFPLKPMGFYTIIFPMEERIGSVLRYFEKNTIAALKLDFGDLSLGDTVHIKGPTTDVTQKVEYMEFDHKPVEKALRGQFTGIKLSQPAKPFDLVYKVKG